jgi:CHAD domain-containing protein
MDFAFGPELAPEENLVRIGARELGAALAVASDGTRAADERIHDVRTHCKKARALLRLARAGFPGWREENGAIREAAKLLSGPRDAAVLITTLEPFTAEAAYSADEAHRLRSRLTSGDHAEGMVAGALAEFVLHAEPIAARAPLWPAGGLTWSGIAKGAARTYAQARRAMGRSQESGAAAEFHEWRKQVKYHMHHLALLRRFDADRFHAARQQLKVLATQLGAHHDLELLGTRLALSVTHDDAPGRRLADEIAARQLTIAHSALARGATLCEVRPSAWQAAVDQQIAAALGAEGSRADA